MPDAVAHPGDVVLNSALSFLGGRNLCQEGHGSSREIDCHSTFLVLSTSTGLPGFSLEAWGISIQQRCSCAVLKLCPKSSSTSMRDKVIWKTRGQKGLLPCCSSRMQLQKCS